MNNIFNDIRPYYDEEIPSAMQRIAENDMFPVLAGYVFPDKSTDEVRALIKSIANTYDFQSKVMYHANLRIINNSIDEFTYGGIENIDKDTKYVYLSNHRDIMLDASLLQNVLVDNDYDTTEITFGANLMKGDLIVDIGKSNKMFKVERPGNNMRAFYTASKHLSDYIRYTVVEKGNSIWIAQRNGRTKDGKDITDQGIINMFRMSGTNDKVKSISELNILPVAISYEWEPCDILKTLELYARQHGPYVKKPGEDLNSIITGIVQPKGKVHLEICKPITAQDLIPYSDLNSNEFNKKVARLIDSRICSQFKLTPNNYIAHDILSGAATYSENYTIEERDKFMAHMSQLDEYIEGCDLRALESIFLEIYANPVDSKNLYSGK